MPQVLSDVIETAMVKHGIDPEIISALKAAVANSDVNGSARAYAYGLDRAYREYGMDGLRYNVMYLMLNMGRWQGEEARWAKKLLKRWSSS